MFKSKLFWGVLATVVVGWSIAIYGIIWVIDTIQEVGLKNIVDSVWNGTGAK